MRKDGGGRDTGDGTTNKDCGPPTDKDGRLSSSASGRTLPVLV